jgi:hypothetical protein
VGARVEDVRVGAERALVDPEEVDAAGEGVGAGLEDEREHLAVRLGFERDLAGLQRAVLGRGRQVVDERVEQPVGTDARRGHAAGDREDVAGVDALLERVDDLVVGDRVALQIALHERLGVLGHLVHQLLAVLLRALGEVVRDRDLLAVVALDARVLVGLHVDQVDHSAHLVLGADRDLGGHHVHAERRLERLEGAVEVGALAVEHVHVDEARKPELGRPLPEAGGGHLDAHDGVDDEQRVLAHAQGPEGVGDEGGLAGRVDQVDLGVAPLEGGERRGDRHATGLLVLVGVRDRRPIGDASHPGGGARLEEQRLVQSRLSRATVAHQGDVADPVCGMSHAQQPPLRAARPSKRT